MNFYKRYMGDYARKTAHLSLTQRGAYDALLDHYYANNGVIPTDHDSLYQTCHARTTLDEEAIRKVADEFFPVNGSGLRHNKRADEELIAYKAQAETNRRIAQQREETKRLTIRSTNGATIGSTKLEVRSQKLEVNKLEALKDKTKKGPRKTEIVELPDWLPLDNWQTFLAMRSRIRKPATVRAQRMLIGRLHELRDQGHNPAGLIAQAELKCWLSFYPPKEA